MCGIAGIVSKRIIHEKLLASAAKSLRHRGPDSKGRKEFEIYKTEALNHIGLVHTRLSIIDLSLNGMQPMTSSSGQYSIVFNGEIYNFKELAKKHLSGCNLKSQGDTEILLELFEKYNIECLTWLRGMFAVCIIDRYKDELYLFRDKFGVKPLYYEVDQNKVHFGSELKAIFALNPDKKYKIDSSALNSFFQLGYVLGEQSILSNIKKVVPGTVVKINLSSTQYEITKLTYWDAASSLTSISSKFDLIVKELADKIKSAVSYRLVSDVPVGIFLSGGYDSSVVSASIVDMAKDLRFFTIGFEDKLLDESSSARQIALALGLQHNIEFCTEEDLIMNFTQLAYYFDEPFADPSSIPTMQLAKLASKYSTVVLSSDGGDEIFAGYDKHQIVLLIHRLSNSKLRLAFLFLRKLFNPLYGKSICLSSKKISQFLKFIDLVSRKLEIEQLLLDAQKYITDESASRYLKNPYKTRYSGKQFPDKSLVDRMLIADIKTHLPDQIMTKVDRSTMAFSIEGREPLLDEELLRYSMSLKDEFKITSRDKKIALKMVAHQLMAKRLLDRPKQGFTPPMKEWLKGPLRNELDKYVNENLLSEKIFNIRELIKAKNRFLNGSHADFRVVWHTLIFQKWINQWQKHIEY